MVLDLSWTCREECEQSLKNTKQLCQLSHFSIKKKSKRIFLGLRFLGKQLSPTKRSNLVPRGREEEDPGNEVESVPENAREWKKIAFWFLPSSLPPQSCLRQPLFSMSAGHSLPPFTGKNKTVRVLWLTPTPQRGLQGPQSDQGDTSQSRFTFERKQRRTCSYTEENATPAKVCWFWHWTNELIRQIWNKRRNTKVNLTKKRKLKRKTRPSKWLNFFFFVSRLFLLAWRYHDSSSQPWRIKTGQLWHARTHTQGPVYDRFFFLLLLLRLRSRTEETGVLSFGLTEGIEHGLCQPAHAPGLPYVALLQIG